MVGDCGAADAAASVSVRVDRRRTDIMNGGLYQHLPSLVGIVGAGQMGAGDETGFFLKLRSRRHFLSWELIQLTEVSQPSNLCTLPSAAGICGILAQRGLNVILRWAGLHGSWDMAAWLIGLGCLAQGPGQR